MDRLIGSEYQSHRHRSHRQSYSNEIFDAIGKSKEEAESKKLIDISRELFDIKSENSKTKLYTLIKYNNKDKLIELGEGDFDSKSFTSKTPESIGLCLSPIPLFVVNSCDGYEEYSGQNPRQYLDNNTICYYQRGKKPEYLDKKGSSIVFHHLHTMHYDHALLELKNTILEKLLWIYRNNYIKNSVEQLDIIKKLNNWRNLDIDKFRSQLYGYQKDEKTKNEIANIARILELISYTNDDINTEDKLVLIYRQLQLFDPRQGKFTQ